MEGSLKWFVNAGRRTLFALLPALARPDDEFARAVLPAAEFRLYLKMDPRDRQHACQIAQELLRRLPSAPDELLRAALLHDVGKAVDDYNPLFRILVHLYTPSEVAAEPRLSGLRGAWQVKRHHHRYGAAMIRECGGDPRVARLVEHHHRPGADTGARLLKRLDDET